MVTILPPDTSTQRVWTGRDDNAGHHHGDIPLAQSPVSMTLYWRATRTSKRRPVGRYSIDLHELVKAGYARATLGAVRLRFQSTGERIEISASRAGPALVVGRNPLTP